MPNITELLLILQRVLSFTNIHHLSDIINAILGLSSPVTTRSIGRLTSISLRSVERFYAQAIDEDIWQKIRILIFKHYFFNAKLVYLLVGDESVEKKAGKSSYGLGRFYSSLAGKVINSVSFLGLSLVNVQEGKSHLLSCTQLVKPHKDTALNDSASVTQAKKVKPTPRCGKGRPKGSKNKPYTEPESLSFKTLKASVDSLLEQLEKYCVGLVVFYLVLDGYYGNQHYLKYAQSKKLKLISKLKCNAYLILPYQGTQKEARGRPTKYDKKLNYAKIPQEAFVNLPNQHKLKQEHTKVWALELYADTMRTQLIKVVIIQKTNPSTGKVSQAILFTNDLALDPVLIIKYYSLRFQIEFDFRDAKQFFGLSDFKNYKQNQLNNAVNIAFTSKLVSQVLLEKYKNHFSNDKLSINDLKAIIRAKMCYEYFLNCSQSSSDDYLNDEIFLDFVKLHAINIE